MVTTPDLSCWAGGSGAVFPINQEEQLGIGQLTQSRIFGKFEMLGAKKSQVSEITVWGNYVVNLGASFGRI
jgi:hypothetical protein